jgi:sulfate permease, SulP family
LRPYPRSWLRGDLLAGATVAAYLVPQVMAYAQVAGLRPAAGLWAAVPALVIYAVLGSSRSLSLGPEATTALMTAAAIGPLAARDSSRYAALASTLALLVGLMAVIAGTVRLGFLADLLSRPVIVGYLTGVALIMIAGQLGAATGVPVAGEAFPAQVASFGERIGGTRPATAAIAAGVLAFLLLLQWQWPRAPGPLLAVLLAAGWAAAFGLSRHGVQVAGPIPAGLPSPAIPDMSPGDLRELLLPAFTVFVVGFSDLVLTARAFARRGRPGRGHRGTSVARCDERHARGLQHAAGRAAGRRQGAAGGAVAALR